jgi:hypothetical protein
VHSPALAFAWEFRQRHRWGFIAVAVYLIVIATIKLLVFDAGQHINLHDGGRFAAVVLMPLTATFMYFLAVFSFGLSGDLAARESIYPARLFTLPLTNAALAGWPMLYGTLVMAILWLATRLFGVWPSGISVPLIWPGLMAASLLAWTQALTWMPYGLPGMRVVVAMLWLGTIDTAVLLALTYNIPESGMVAFLAPLVPLAYLVARFAVARARRGDVPDWRGQFSRIGQITDFLPRRHSSFHSAERAQAWFEWRRYGRTLPAMVALVLPFELAVLFAADDAPGLVFLILSIVLVTPPFMAAFTAATARRANPHVSDSYGVTPFLATRPLTSAALIGAKLKMTILTTIAAWLLVLVAVPIALNVTDTWPVVAERARRFTEGVGSARAVVVTLLVFSALVASTWKQLVQSLYVGLSGREWIIKVNAVFLLAFIIFIGPVVDWVIENNDVQVALWNALPWIPAVLVLLKMSAAAWVAARLYHGRLVSDRTLVTAAAVWCVVVLALYGVLVWIIDTPFIPRYFLALVAILAIPLARLSASPLALAGNRHR